MATTLFGSTVNPATSKLKADKQAVVGALQEGLSALATYDDSQVMSQGKLTLVSHPQDFQIGRHGVRANEPVNFWTLMTLQSADDQFDLIIYRLVIDREIAFGTYNGRFVENPASATCTTMRAQRLVDEFVPDNADEETAKKGFTLLAQIIVIVGAIVPQAEGK